MKWRTVEGFPDYRVSSDGLVQSRRIAKSDKEREWRTMCPSRYYATRGGSPYLSVVLYNEHSSKSFKVHRLVLEAFVGSCPPGMQCRHLNGDASDNRIRNLCWGTPKQNSDDIDRHGRRAPAKGVRHPDAKLTDKSVYRVRREWLEGASHRDLAKRYEVSPSAMMKALRGESWRHVPMPDGERQRILRPALTAEGKIAALALLGEGRSQREVADILGIHPSSISRIANGVVRSRRKFVT